MLHMAHYYRTEIKMTTRYHLPLVRVTNAKNLQIINARESMEKREPSYALILGMKIGNSHDGKQYGGSSGTWPGVTSLKPELPGVPRLDWGGAEGPGEGCASK